MQEMPVALLFDAHGLLSIILANEYADPGATFTDQHGRVLTYVGKLIRFADFGHMMNGMA
jgi:hypothetical protein